LNSVKGIFEVHRTWASFVARLCGG
jgi:hypothetical protein